MKPYQLTLGAIAYGMHTIVRKYKKDKKLDEDFVIQFLKDAQVAIVKIEQRLAKLESLQSQ